jgi:hypothetical protein
MHPDFFLPAWDDLASGRPQELAASVCTALPQFRLESVANQMTLCLMNRWSAGGCRSAARSQRHMAGG